ncbi:hypothetical protein [Photorhabdus antumapuensis]|nr:hypothetical protein [Photorhabdus antumapuensis]
MEKSWKNHGKIMEKSWKNHGKIMEMIYNYLQAAHAQYALN